MGTKRVIPEFNNNNPKHVVLDHHRGRHHPEKKKVKSEAKLLHTLNSHFKKLVRSRFRTTLSLPKSDNVTNAATVSPEEHDKDHHLLHRTSCMAMHASQWTSSSCSWSCNEDYDRNRFIDFNSDKVCYEDVYGGDHEGGDMGVFKLGQELCWVRTTSFLESENNDGPFGGDCAFAPDVNVAHNLVVVLEEDGSRYGSYLSDPVTNSDNDNEGKLPHMLELSSQEDMINEFFKVNLFSS